MTIDLSDWRLWLAVGQTLAIVGLWLRKPGESAGEAVTLLRGRVDVMEERMKHMPTTTELAELLTQLAAIRERLNGFADMAENTRKLVHRIEDFLRDNK